MLRDVCGGILGVVVFGGVVVGVLGVDVGFEDGVEDVVEVEVELIVEVSGGVVGLVEDFVWVGYESLGYVGGRVLLI